MKPTNTVKPFGAETDWDGLYLALEKAENEICKDHDLAAVIWALSGLVWRNLHRYAPWGSAEINSLSPILILSDWPQVDPAKTSKIEPLLEEIARIPDRRRRAVVVLSYIQALALVVTSDFAPDCREIYKRDVPQSDEDKPCFRR